MRILFFLIALPCMVQAQSVLTEVNYKVFSTALNKEVTLDDVVVAMQDYDVLLFGEEHNDSVTHYLQAQMLERMHKVYGSQLALSMEMFDRDVQPVMDEYLSGYIKEKHFKKDARVWSNYKDYQPMVMYAKEQGLDVICANAASRYTNLAGREGQATLQKLPKSTRVNMAPLPYKVAAGPYYNKLMRFMYGEDHMASDTTSTLPAMNMGGFDLITAQSLWDATMAWSIASYLKKRPNRKKKILQLNGRFHSDEYMAIYTQLKHYNPKLRILVISSFSDENFETPNWESHKINGDFILLTDPLVPKSYESK